MYTKLFLLICVVFLVHQQGTAAGLTSRVRNCNTPNDCAVDECCVSAYRPARRRRRAQTAPIGQTVPTISPHTLSPQGLGTCRRLGQINDICFINPRTSSTGVYSVICPCKWPLMCGGHEGGRAGTCQRQSFI